MTFAYKTEPFKHQREEFERSRALPARALLWEQGCVDADTEYLSPTGWRKISNYDGGLVAQVDPVHARASFVKPDRYVVEDCAEFIHLNSRRGLDQALSPNHRVLYFTKHGHELREQLAEQTASELQSAPRATKRLPVRFVLSHEGAGTGLTEAQLRLQVAVMADGSFPAGSPSTTSCVMRLKKERKVARLHALLDAARVEAKVHFEPATGFTVFSFYAPLRLKVYPWWDLTEYERNVLMDEVPHWDGTVLTGGRGWSFCSRHESDVDFLQFVAASTGLVTTKSKHAGYWYLNVRGTRTEHVVAYGTNVSRFPSKDGKAYCFQVPSGALVLRRGSWVFLTGNCGKTKPIIDTAASLWDAGEITGMLVLAPNGVHSNWVHDELPTHLSCEARVQWWRSSKTDTKWFREEVDVFLKHQGFKILCMSYDAIMTDYGAKVARKFLTSNRCLMVCDESHRIKSPGSKRTIRVRAAGHYAPYRRIATGTLVDDTPFDTFSQIDFVQPGIWQQLGIQDATTFKAYFGVFKQGVQHFRDPQGNLNARAYEEVVGFRNLLDMKQVIDTVGTRLLKEQVLDLPPKLFSKFYFEMSPLQAKLYRQLATELRATFPDGARVTAELAITKLLRLQQCVSGYLPADREEDLRLIESPNPRLKALREVVEDVTGKFIVVGKYNVDIDGCASTLRDMGIETVVVDGRTDDDDREAAKKAFQKGSARAFVMKPMEGLTLHAAKTMIFFNNGFHLRPRLQAEDRPHRIGQTDPVKYIDIVATDTVDDKKILPSLRNKREMAAVVQGDELKAWI